MNHKGPAQASSSTHPVTELAKFGSIFDVPLPPTVPPPPSYPPPPPPNYPPPTQDASFQQLPPPPSFMQSNYLSNVSNTHSNYHSMTHTHVSPVYNSNMSHQTPYQQPYQYQQHQQPQQHQQTYHQSYQHQNQHQNHQESWRQQQLESSIQAIRDKFKKARLNSMTGPRHDTHAGSSSSQPSGAFISGNNRNDAALLSSREPDRSRETLVDRKKRFSSWEKTYVQGNDDTFQDSNEFSVDSSPEKIVIEGQNVLVGTSTTMLKRYLRLTAPPEPFSVRPLPLLEKAFNYVISQWLEKGDYGFCCEQLKSIRQDLSIQHIRNKFSLTVYQSHARLALMIGDLSEYNQCQSHIVTLQRTFFTETADQVSGDGDTASPGPGISTDQMIEFTVYRLLYHIISEDTIGFRNILLSLNPEHRNHPMVKKTLKIRRCILLGDYVSFFKIYENENHEWLVDCLLMKLVTYMRHIATQRLLVAMKPRLISCEYLLSLLLFDANIKPLACRVEDGIFLDPTIPPPSSSTKHWLVRNKTKTEGLAELRQFLELRNVVFDDQKLNVVTKLCPPVVKPVVDNQDSSVKVSMQKGITHADLGLAYAM